MFIRVLVVDDDQKIRDLVKDTLTGEGFKINAAATAEEALNFLHKSLPDLMVLDWNLPDRTGLDLCRLLRSDPKTAGLPVVMLTAVDGLKEKVGALETGADDYITKPFHVIELRARIHAVLRRKTPWLIQDQVLEFKSLRIEPSNYKAYVNGKDAGLTKIEFEILYLLAVNAGHAMQRAYIENRVLDMDFPGESRTLDVHLSHLRSKLGPKVGEHIETARGLGYIFVGDRK